MGKSQTQVVRLGTGPGDNTQPVGPGNLMPVEPLGTPGVAHQQDVTTASADVALTATCRRVSIAVDGCKARYKVGTSEQTADAATSHAIRDGERLDFAVPAGAHISVIRDAAATTDGVLEISELM